MSTETSPSKILPIEGMRGLAALYVVIGHVFTMVDPWQKLRRPNAQPEWLAWLASPFWYGHLAVAAFITISGFCLQWALLQRGDGTVSDFRAYMGRRARRILPPYYACLVMSLAVCWAVTSRQSGLPWSQYLPVTWENFWAHALLIHNWSPDWMYKINGVLWSIAIEFQLYFLLPVLAVLLARWGELRMVLLTGLAVVLVLAGVPRAEKYYIWYIALFLFGMAAAHIAQRPVRIPDKAWGWISVVALALGARIAGEKMIPISDTFFALGTAALMVLLVRKPAAALTRWLGAPAMVALGAFSYSLYLTHHPILQVVYVNVVRPVATTATKQIAALGLLGVGAAIFGALGFYWIVERPFVGPKRPR